MKPSALALWPTLMLNTLAALIMAAVGVFILAALIEIMGVGLAVTFLVFFALALLMVKGAEK